MWLATYPDSPLKDKMEYYIEPAEQETVSGILFLSSFFSPAFANDFGYLMAKAKQAISLLFLAPPTNPNPNPPLIAGLSGSVKWVGGVFAPNIYGIPYGSNSVLIIDPVTNTADTTTITGLSGWYGGVLAPNGKICGIPLNSSSVLIIDPVTNTADTTTIAGLSESSKWVGGVLAPNGKIYGIPLNSS